MLRDQKKTRGKTNLTRLLREGKPLKFFSVSADRMREFAQEAKRHGLLFVPMRDHNDPDHIEIAIWADDAAKVERIIERMQLDVVETGEAEIMTDVDHTEPEQAQEGPDRQPAQAADGPIPFEPDDADYDLGFTQPAPSPAEPGNPPPSRSTRRTDLPSAPPSASRSSSPNISPAPRADRVRARGERPSVRDELREIRAMLRATQPVAPKPKAPIRIHRSDQAR